MSRGNAGATSHWKVGAIGAGPGGLGLAIKLVQSGHCNSYFKNAAGKIATQLPQTSRRYADQTKRFTMKEYERV